MTVAHPVTPNEAAASAAADSIFFTFETPEELWGMIAPGRQ
jgi:hypothetical protein